MSQMRLWMVLLLVIVACVTCVSAQDDDEPLGLIVRNLEVDNETDVLGLTALVARGQIANTNPTVAYSGIDIFAEMADADGEIVGEGFGFLVDACDTALRPDFVLQPGDVQNFRVVLELFDFDSPYETVDIIPEGVETEPEPINPFLTFPNVDIVVSDEVIAVEWADDSTLRYAVGCDGDVFTSLAWYEADLTSDDAPTRTVNPDSEFVDEGMLNRTGLSDPAVYVRSYLSFHPNGQRMLYLDEIGVFYTAENDGTFQRILYDDQARITLQGIIWLPDWRFLAYFFGAHGDPVRYFTGSVFAQRISVAPLDVVPSITVPGPTPDGARVVTGLDIDGTTGYYLTSTINGQSQLLFEADLPGNNYPAPIYLPREGASPVIYIVRPVDGGNRLDCYDTATGEVSPLGVLPLRLTTDYRAWTSLSPDGQTLALAANGQDGGVWTFDLSGFDGCLPRADETPSDS